jgi:hypothetical protein
MAGYGFHLLNYRKFATQSNYQRQRLPTLMGSTVFMCWRYYYVVDRKYYKYNIKVSDNLLPRLQRIYLPFAELDSKCLNRLRQ